MEAPVVAGMGPSAVQPDTSPTIPAPHAAPIRLLERSRWFIDPMVPLTHSPCRQLRPAVTTPRRESERSGVALASHRRRESRSPFTGNGLFAVANPRQGVAWPE